MAVVPEVLVTLTTTDLAEEEYDPYDGVERPPGKLDPAIGEKGLGTLADPRIQCLDFFVPARWGRDAQTLNNGGSQVLLRHSKIGPSGAPSVGWLKNCDFWVIPRGVVG